MQRNGRIVNAYQMNFDIGREARPIEALIAMTLILGRCRVCGHVELAHIRQITVMSRLKRLCVKAYRTRFADILA